MAATLDGIVESNGAVFRAGTNEYNSHARAPGKEPTARVRPTHTENSNALIRWNPVIAKERDHGELAQAPAAD
jgi:hypothetical protein